MILCPSSDDELKSSLRIKNKEIVKAKLIHVLLYGGMVIVNYLPVFYKQTGMSSVEIGVLASLMPFLSFIGAPVLSGLSDRTGRHKTVFLSSILIYNVLLTSIFPFSVFTTSIQVTSNQTTPRCPDDRICMTEIISHQTRFFILFFWIGLTFFFKSTIPTILDLISISLDNEVDYGKIRVWGAFGFGFFGFLSALAASRGQMTEIVDDITDFSWPFAMFFVLNVLGSILCTMVKTIDNRNPSTIVIGHLRVLLTTPLTVMFMVVILTNGISHGVVESLLFVFLKDLGAPHALLGLAMAVCCGSEVIVFPFSGTILRRLGTKTVLFLSLLMYIVRLTSYSLLQNPWLVLVIEPLHGITYALMWSSCVCYAKETSPPEVAAVSIGLMTGVYVGLGRGLGGLLGGVVYHYYGPRILFRSCAVLSFVGIVLHVFSMRFFKKEETYPPKDSKQSMDFIQK